MNMSEDEHNNASVATHTGVDTEIRLIMLIE